MSRRRMRSGFNTFISDDEEEFEEDHLNNRESTTPNERVMEKYDEQVFIWIYHLIILVINLVK